MFFLSVRNKYWTICDTSINESLKINFTCSKHYKGTSTAMEVDVVLEGFRKLCMYGLIYGKIISDGNSSVYNKLLSSVSLINIRYIICMVHNFIFKR
ncbi:hypothetical protein, partial [Enterobacter cloacae complex sp. 2DZ2F20B]|uniref:hypothetical protein n=1 Tax=Enterobacter cloacae complex sp. 2DZ2F20B TaxID=2511993 RepID=UPI0034D23B38